MLINHTCNDSCQSSKEDEKNTGNTILNHDFSYGLYLWNPNCCEAFVVPAGYHKGLAAAIVTNRKECWHGLEQDITSKVSEGSTYTVSACVGASGTSQGSVEVLATLKLVHENSQMKFIFNGKKSVSNECWDMLEGSFSLSTMPDQVIFFLEGPPAGTDLLMKSVVISCPSSSACDDADFGVNIITNTSLNYGTNGWFPFGNCTMSVQTGSPLMMPPMARDSLGAHEPLSGRYILVTNRTQNWMGPAQMITEK
uniref:Putative ovule protein n=1 Tax=Solanum chacoense TaxID=4108 RepID=A0A0V0IIT8_SOLCH